MKTIKVDYGRFYNEISGTQIKDYFSFWIMDFPVFVIRRYMDCHSYNGSITWYVGIIGVVIRL